MGGIIKIVKKTISNKFENYTPSNKSKKEKCKVDYKNFIRDKFFIDLDDKKLGLTETSRCDYLIIAYDSEMKKSWIIALELKSGNFKVNDVVKQLQGGAKFAEEFFLDAIKTNNNNSKNPNFDFEFRPFIFSKKSGHHTRQGDIFRNKFIKFNEKPLRIRWRNCGEEMTL